MDDAWWNDRREPDPDFIPVALWLGLDAFGRAVLLRLAESLRQHPSLTTLNRLLSVPPADDPVPTSDGPATPVSEVDARTDAATPPASDVAAATGHPAPSDVVTTLSPDVSHRLSGVATAIKQLLTEAPAQGARRTIRPHLWVIYDLHSAEADHVTEWLPDLLETIGTQIHLRLHLLIRFQTWDPHGEWTPQLHERLRSLIGKILAPGQPGHKATVFVVTDRNEFEAFFQPAEQEAVASHFAQLVLLSGAPWSLVPGVREVFQPPSAGLPDATAMPRRAARRRRVLARRTTNPASWVEDRARWAEDQARREREQAHRMWGPFAGIGAKVLLYPHHEIWLDRTAHRLDPLIAALTVEPPESWSIPLPSPGTPRKITDYEKQIPAPPRLQWQPRSGLASDFDSAGEVQQLEQRIDHHITGGSQSLGVRIWVEQQKGRLLDLSKEIRNSGEARLTGYQEGLAAADLYILQGKAAGGILKLFERLLERCQGDLNDVFGYDPSLPVAAAASRDTSAIAPKRPPAAANSSLPADPFAPGSWRDDVRAARLAEAVARQVNPRLVLVVAIVTAAMCVLLVGKAIQFAEASTLGILGRALTLWPGAPAAALIAEMDANIPTDTVLFWIVIAALAVGFAGFGYLRAAHTSRARITQAFLAFNDHFIQWEAHIREELKTQLRHHQDDHDRWLFDSISGLLAQREKRLADLLTYRRDGRISPQSDGVAAQSAADRFTTSLDAAAATPRPLSAADVDAVIEAFRGSETAARWSEIEARSFYDDLLAGAAEHLGEVRPNLRDDVAQLTDDISHKLPTSADVLVRPLSRIDRRNRPPMVRLLAIPAGLQEQYEIRQLDALFVPAPIEQQLCAVAVRHGFTIEDLLPIPPDTRDGHVNRSPTAIAPPREAGCSGSEPVDAPGRLVAGRGTGGGARLPVSRRRQAPTALRKGRGSP